MSHSHRQIGELQRAAHATDPREELEHAQSACKEIRRSSQLVKDINKELEKRHKDFRLYSRIFHHISIEFGGIAFNRHACFLPGGSVFAMAENSWAQEILGFTWLDIVDPCLRRANGSEDIVARAFQRAFRSVHAHLWRRELCGRPSLAIFHAPNFFADSAQELLQDFKRIQKD